jgi:pimeloyl-ACP methyl ester carboxylesterase
MRYWAEAYKELSRRRMPKKITGGPSIHTPLLSTYLNFILLFILINSRSFCQKPIDTTEVITVGGIKQFIQIKGKDNSKPILLFLHGGPGSSLLHKADQITGKLQQHFVVVHWDQRETGGTLKLNKSSQPLTLSLFYNDTHDLIDSLLKRFQRPKLYLAGYSWGSGLGFYIADKYPELLYAYIAISPVINQWKSDSISLSMLKETMGKKARKELSQVKIPFENAEQLYYHRKWLFKHEGQKIVSLGLRKSFVQAWAVTWFDVWSRSCDINLFESLPTIKCPVYFFAGKKDYNTNYSITREYFNKVSTPKKDLFLFANAGHGLPETDPGLFQDIIIDKILPETFHRPIVELK